MAAEVVAEGGPSQVGVGRRRRGCAGGRGRRRSLSGGEARARVVISTGTPP